MDLPGAPRLGGVDDVAQTIPRHQAPGTNGLLHVDDQCGVDLGSAALAKIQASADKYPTDQPRGVAPDKM